MAVLRHGDLKAPGLSRCDSLLSFAKFERAVAELDRCLAPGGFLAIRHSHFRFRDTTVAARFECVLSVTLPPAVAPPLLFGRDNRRLNDGS